MSALPPLADELRFLPSEGQAGPLARSVDWARTPLGPPQGWSQSLKNIAGTMLRSGHPMVLFWGPELIQLYNDAFIPSFGAGKHPAAMGQRARECWSEIWHIIGPLIEAVMQRGRPCWFEDQLVPFFRNGRIEDIYWTYSYSPVFDDEGRVGGTLVVCAETTARVIAERRLRLLRLLADKLALATDAEAVFQLAAEALAHGSDDVPFAVVWREPAGGGAPLRSVAVGLEGPRLAAVDGALRSSLSASADDGVVTLRAPAPEGQAAYVARVPTRSGRQVWIAFGLSQRLPFDEPYRIFLSQILEQLMLAQERIDAFRLRATMESERRNLLLQAPVATAILAGPDHVFELANALYCQLVGRADLVGKAYLEAFPELRGTQLPAILDRVYRTGEPFVSSEISTSLQNDDGQLEERFFRFNLEPMRDDAGAVVGMMAVAVDLTEQVTARQVLEKAQVERERLLADLESASRAKDEFLAMLGHELRNPLAPIVTALQLVKLRGQGGSTELQIIERQVQHLVRLVDDLLDVSKVTRGKIALRREPVELADAIGKAVEISSLMMEQRGHHVTVEVPPGLRCFADPVRLAQVFSNLLTNAARYTEQAGNIRVRAEREDGQVTISVEDDGIGIAPELLPRIFEPFVQGKRSADRAEGGLGIGLTLVRSLVELHGGTVTAHSGGAGKGSRFEVRLPLSTGQDEQPPASKPVAAAKPATARLRVMVVDDNVDAADILGELLRAAGHDVFVAYDPLVALSALGRWRPQVAVLDIGLPAMDGYELASRIRAEMGADCRLIALSGYGLPRDRARSEVAGFEEHLVKPVEAEDLLRVIDRGPPARADAPRRTPLSSPRLPRVPQ